VSLCGLSNALHRRSASAFDKGKMTGQLPHQAAIDAMKPERDREAARAMAAQMKLRREREAANALKDHEVKRLAMSSSGKSDYMRTGRNQSARRIAAAARSGSNCPHMSDIGSAQETITKPG
jgi:hypothetical protein